MRLREWGKYWGSLDSSRGCLGPNHLQLHRLHHQHLQRKGSSRSRRRTSKEPKVSWVISLLEGKVRAVSGASCADVPFQIPVVQAGDRDCSLCHQSFASTKALRHHQKTHTGDTGWSCEVCGKVLSTKLMLELHIASCGKSTKQHNCKECGRGYTTKQALVAHLKAKHGPPPTPEELTCPTSGKLFKVHKTMREHLAVHKGPYPCPVEGCGEGPYSLPKRLNRHLADKHGFAAHKQYRLFSLLTCLVLAIWSLVVFFFSCILL